MRSLSLSGKLVFVFLSLFIAGSIAPPAQAAVVSEIVIEGAKRFGRDSVEVLISQRVGREYRESEISGDVKKIHSTGNFYNVRVEKEVSSQGVKLTYKLQENPVLVDLSFKGNKNLDDDNIEEILNIKKGTIVGTVNIHAQTLAIMDLYAREGYSNARVSYSVDPEAAGGISVLYKIKEGPRETISKVKISGNENIKTKNLNKVIFSSPRRFYSLGQKGLFVRDEVERDSERIRFAYMNEGYLEAQVLQPQLTHNKQKNSYEIVFDIEEGDRYFVSDIFFEGVEEPPEFNKDKFLHNLKLKKGKPFGRTKLTSDINFITAFYTNKGYADVNVSPSVEKQEPVDGNPLVRVGFSVEKGQVFHINRINVIGNDKTIDRVIRRQIPIIEGDLYKSADIALIRPFVGRTGFFRAEEIEVSTQPAETGATNELDITVRVKESSTAQFNLGAGVSSVEDFIFFGSIKESNLFGYGKSLEANANFGNITDTYTFRYGDRNFLDTNWSFNTSLFRLERDYVDYDRKSTGFTIGIGRSLYRQLWGNIYYRWEDLEIRNPSQAAIQSGIMSSSGILSAVGADLTWDSRDNFQFPRSGHKATVLYEHSGPFGGETDLRKLVIESNTWVPIVRGSFLSVKVAYDRVFLRGNSTSHAIDERLFLGGSSNLRGFDYREIAAGGNSTLGGTERIYIKSDYVVPLFEPLGLYGVLFFDIGNVFDSERGFQFSVNYQDLRKDFGYGFWWRSPLGFVKIEFGYPIDRLSGEEKRQVNFSIGTSF
ncbi:MAG: outer membrane protein assembly factor BamA [Candidatus Mycalebacterium zealandia]|nr:MAG: outer membrane protein assembly factor BamA [Candidatus Mycalebacterium zealandia]